MFDKILRITFAVLVVAVVAGYFYMKSEEKRIQESFHKTSVATGFQAPVYTGSWRSSDGSILREISMVLAKYKIRDCGEYYYKVRSDGASVYLVAGTGNGKTWSFYIVRSEDGEMDGPLAKQYEPPY